MRTKMLALSLAACAMIVPCESILAQTAMSSNAETKAPVVTIPFFVSRPKGAPANPPTPAELSILDNKKPAPSVLAIRKGKDMPLRLGVLFDVSNSENQSELYRAEVKAAVVFLNQVVSGAEDKAFIGTFAETPSATQFMSREQLDNYEFRLKPGGGTALYDAIEMACSQRMKTDSAPVARRVLVLVTDGWDNYSRIDFDTAIASVQSTATVIFAVSTDEHLHSSPGDKQLPQLAEKSGGQAFLHLSPRDIANTFSEIKEQIDDMYEVTFVPAQPVQPGQYRQIELKSLSDEKMKIRAPKGYYSGEKPEQGVAQPK